MQTKPSIKLQENRGISSTTTSLAYHFAKEFGIRAPAFDRIDNHQLDDRALGIGDSTQDQIRFELAMCFQYHAWILLDERAAESPTYTRIGISAA